MKNQQPSVFHLMSKNRQQPRSVDIVHIVLPGSQVVITKKKTVPFAIRYIRQSQSTTSAPESKKAEIIPFLAYLCGLPTGSHNCSNLFQVLFHTNSIHS